MKRTFKFEAVINGQSKVLTVNVTMMNGGVQTNKFCPNELLTGGLSFVTPVQGEMESEFVQDCKNIISGIQAAGRTDTRIEAFIGGLMRVVMNHINRCGRLIFGDLLIYLDCYALLLDADGFSEHEIRNSYIQVCRSIVQLYDDYVLNTANLAPLHLSPIYHILFSPTLK